MLPVTSELFVLLSESTKLSVLSLVTVTLNFAVSPVLTGKVFLGRKSFNPCAV
jgi:hypothetical protein